MNLNTFYELSVATQVALGSGFLAYALAYAGFREGHYAVDAVFITLIFSVVASLVFTVASPIGLWGATALFTLGVAAFWRVLARRWCLRMLSLLHIHREDGVHRAWAQIVQTDKSVGQCSVHTKDGRVLYLNDRPKFKGLLWDGLYLGGDGSVVMIVEEEEFPDGRTEVRDGITSADWGTRMTYLPASAIERVNIRLN